MERTLIGAGYSAEVYDYGNNNVLKLLKENFDNYLIQKEYEISKFAYLNNILTPEPKELIQENNRKGIVFQKINGKTLSTMGEMLYKKETIQKMVELQYTINKTEFINDKYTYKNNLEYAVSENKYLTDDEKTIIKRIIYNLPDGNRLCHSDFHPMNVMYFENKYYIIDWALGVQGTMAYDVGKTIMLIKYIGLQENEPYIKYLYNNILRNKISKTHIKKYCKISGMDKKELEKIKLPLCIETLNVCNNEIIVKKLMKIIKKEIKKANQHLTNC
jgi:hypothetical protein